MMVSISVMVIAVMKSVVKFLLTYDVLSQDLIVLDRAVTSAGEARSDRGSSDECEDDGVMKIVCLLFLQRMRITIRTWKL